jgi:GR25 family glycosyltransferase involved in LPS biosynthesis
MDLITKTVYINLDKRVDRKENLLDQFEKIGYTNYERFPAIETAFGGLGCCQSHLKILNDFFMDRTIMLNNIVYEKEGTNILMIIEDDAEFIVSREVLDQYIMSFANDPLAYGMCLGFNPHHVRPYNELFRRSIHVATTSCYLVKLSIIPELIKCFKEAEVGLKQISERNLAKNSKEFILLYHKYAIDQMWKHLHSKYIWLIPKQKCVEQYANYSDIQQRFETIRY